MDDTYQRIIDATMTLIRDKGYMSTTTKDIAKSAQVNECTIFRKFKSKKDIVLSGLKEDRWRPNFAETDFAPITWELQADLEMFAAKYLQRITPDMVKLSIGLRAPQIYSETADMIQKIPELFLTSLKLYLLEMHRKGKLPEADFDCLAEMFLASYFGFVFFKASFEDHLISHETSEYIKKTVAVFIRGIVSEE